MEKLQLPNNIVIFSFILLFFWSESGYAEDAKLTNIIVTNSQDHLLLYLTVEGAFPEKIENAILSGVPVTFSLIVHLSKIRSLWWDKEISSIGISHTLKYDNLKKEYIIHRSWEGDRKRKTQSFREAKLLMTEVDSLKIIELNKLSKGKPYQIMTKAKLSKFKLPLYLHYILFFLSIWDFETDWYTIDFTY